MAWGLRKQTCFAAFLAAATVSGFGLIGHAGTARAADLGGAYGGDCCADLEARVAELEATTARTGNKKVSIQIYGKMNRAVEFWDDGDQQNAYVVNNGFESSRFGIKGQAQLAPGWSAGYRFEIEMLEALSNSLNQFDSHGVNDLNVRHSYMFLHSDKLGELRWGLTSTAKDDITKLAQPIDGLNDTITSDMEANRSFFLRSKGIKGTAGLSDLTFSDIGRCYSSADAFDCSTRRDAVAYWSPVFAGFQFAADWGADDTWALGLLFKHDIGNFQLSGDIAYENISDLAIGVPVAFGDRRINEAGGSAGILHKPTGLYAFFAYSNSQDDDSDRQHAGIFTHTDSPDMNAYDIQGGWQHKFSPIGDTTFFGGFVRIKDGLGGAGGPTRELGAGTIPGVNVETEITGSQVDHWYLGVDQGIDDAYLHLYCFYEHFTPSVNLVDSSLASVGAPLDDFDLVFTGARIYF